MLPARSEEWLPEATVEIPLMGHVAAGVPFEAYELQETLSVPAGIWPSRRVFALRVRGTSMIDDGIHDGDYLIVEPRESAENGQTVVAEVDGAVTVKRYHRTPDGEVRLQPANPEMLPLVTRGDHVRIRGVVVGVMRKHGFQRQPPRPKPRLVPPPPALEEEDGLDIEANALDSQLARWTDVVARAREQRRPSHQIAMMEDLGRDLQALRDWCARTAKPALRRALLGEANRILRKMHRYR